ncbi:MAG: carboxypeptidase-like regulatory domain-containing protein [Bacteroidetes bacterium]|nr:carboxypeptidase-like regulatory domain-containing protein [Bacteroidota bacterium]
MKNILILLMQFSVLCAVAQNKLVKGYVHDGSTAEMQSLFGANVSTIDGLHGTMTDENGYFEFKVDESYSQIKVSYIGFKEKVIDIPKKVNELHVMLDPDVMEEVQVVKKKLDRSYIVTYNEQTINSAELTKAACCNLSESFETNATVDVSFSDAVTGAKKMKMLGLNSIYTQTMFENMPSIRGQANSFGMLYVPGPFMNSISINKGAGSVVNGYEAITGQINYNYKEPDNSERFYLNLFASRHGQFELNTNVSHRFNKKWSTILLAHGRIHEFKHDSNNDSFQDVPLNESAVISNKWKYNGDKFKSQFGVNYTFDERESGQLPNLKLNENKTQLFRTTNINRRWDAFAKTGFMFNNQLQSIGVQYRYYNHQQQGWYGNRFYNAKENYGNVNFIFQSKMQNHNNEMKVGASYVFNKFDEYLDALNLGRTENVPGVFAEYTYQDYKKLSLVAGIRADYNSIHGFWISPKFNFKYIMPKDFTLKLAVGKGYRTANIIAENIQALASNRVISIDEKLGYESAWNVGGSLMKEFNLGFQPASIVVDYYRTDFTNQIVSDYETPTELHFYNLDGKSYANSLQIEARVEATKGLDIQLAYKFDDVHVNYNSGLKIAPYVPRHKFLTTIDYETPNKKWRFNVTGQLYGKSRLPSTSTNPVAYQRPDESKIFFNLNSQITAVVKKWEFYLGAENLTNYWQKDAIIASDDAFGKYFDASMIWGPLGGPRIYGGLRLTIPYKEKK